jgi:hypothetical protein
LFTLPILRKGVPGNISVWKGVLQVKKFEKHWLKALLTASQKKHQDPVALLPKKEPQHSLNRRLGVPQRRSARCGEVKIFYPVENRTPAFVQLGS